MRAATTENSSRPARFVAGTTRIMQLEGIYEALQIDNPYLQDLAMTTIKLRRSGEITMLDEVSAYYDLYMLTNNPTAAAWGWRYWANQNGMNW